MNSAAKFWAIVPAAGIGSRMGANKAKQYLPLGNRSVIEHTIAKLLNLNAIEGVMVTLRDGDQIWPQLAISQHPKVFTTLGGAERADSVLKGLQALQKKALPHHWVLVHDAARPCVQSTTLAAMINTLAEHPVGGILATPVADTLKQSQPSASNNAQQSAVLNEISQTLNRTGIWQAQTPQMFRLGDLLTALDSALASGLSITDEASAMEHAGFKVALYPGQRDNIKITNPEDLALAEFILSRQLPTESPQQ